MSENVHQLFPASEIDAATAPTAAALPTATYVADIAIQLEKVRKAAEDAVNLFRVMPLSPDTTLTMLRAIHEPLMQADKTNVALSEVLSCKGSA